MRCRLIFTLLAVVFVVPVGIEAQTGRVAMKATVSETVTLSVAPTFSQSNVEVVNLGSNTVRIIMTGDDRVIRIPLLVRSNTSFKILAESQTGGLSQLMVTDVHPTGSLVSPHVVNALDKRPKADLNVTGPFVIASGPRISLGGTLNSPNNALQITVLIGLKPRPRPGSPVQLTFVATAGLPIQ